VENVILCASLKAGLQLPERNDWEENTQAHARRPKKDQIAGIGQVVRRVTEKSSFYPESLWAGSVVGAIMQGRWRQCTRVIEKATKDEECGLSWRKVGVTGGGGYTKW